MNTAMTRRTALKSTLFGATAAGLGACESYPNGDRLFSQPGANHEYERNLTPGNTPVRFAAFDHRVDYPADGDIEGMVRRIAEAGYSAATTMTSFGRRNPWLDASDDEVNRLIAACEHHDIDIFDVMIWTNLIHPSQSQRRQNLAYAAENVEAAHRLGARMVTMVTGGNDTEYYIGAHPDNWSGATWNRTIKSIRRILDDTAGMTPALGMEAVITTNLDGPIAHRRLMNDVGGSRVKVCLDPTNMLNLNRIFRTSELLDMCFEMLGEDIIGCHAKDDIVERDSMLLHITQVRAGTGEMDYETYLANISRMKWPRTLLIEHVGPYEKSRDELKALASKLGVSVVEPKL